MAKFCTKCGRKLEDGEVCTCSAPVQAAPQESQYQAAPQQEAPQADTQYQEMPQANTQYQEAPQTDTQYQAAPQQEASQAQYQQGPQNQFYQSAPQGQPNQQYQQYTQGQPNQQYTQGQPNQQAQSQQAEWFNETKDNVVAGTKSMFAEIMPILKAPVTRIRELAAAEKHITGIGFISAKTIVAVLIYLIGIIMMAIKPYSRSMVVAYAPVFLMVILVTGGADILEAFLLKLFTGLFKGKTSLKSMLAMVGGRSLYQVAFVFVCGIIALGSQNMGVALYLVLAVFISALEYASYHGTVEMEENKKLYAFASARACTMLAIFIITWFFQFLVGVIAGGMGALSIFNSLF